jgi:hypothetical protein
MFSPFLNRNNNGHQHINKCDGAPITPERLAEESFDTGSHDKISAM